MGAVMAHKIPESLRMKIPKEDPPAHARRRSHWVWPLGLALAGLGGAAAFMSRGCWHKDMGWPTKHDDEFSYQVCMGCGIKRLFDPQFFRAYGPYGYDMHDLIAHERALRMQRARRHEERLAASRKQNGRTPEPRSDERK